MQPLTIGELWAVAITLRIVLVENLRRIAKRIVDSRAGRRSGGRHGRPVAGRWRPHRRTGRGVLPPQAQTTFPDSFLVQLVHRLRDQDPSIAPALEWLDEQLARQGTTADAVVRDEHQRQVAASVTVRNIITSMRLISDVDWTELFERVSLVDEVFKAGSDFADMDFPTRNLYRSAVEELARGCELTELEVAHAAVADGAARATERDADGERRRLHDPGYYLIAGGRRRFRSGDRLQAACASLAGTRLSRAGDRRLCQRRRCSSPPACWPSRSSVAGLSGVEWRWLLLLGVLGLVPAMDLAVALVNHIVTRGFRATLLPALELRGGVPADLRTLVAVPTLLTSLKDIEEQIGRLEIHHLASPQGELHFALLSDWRDAPSEHVDGDEELLAAAKEGIAQAEPTLWTRAGRRRAFCCCIGGGSGTRAKAAGSAGSASAGSCASSIGSCGAPRTRHSWRRPAVPKNVRYVITLDADTRLPRETVGRLIGKMAHPLNRPRLDAGLGRVVEGYAILQPRVTPALPVGREGSLFLRVFSSATGIDPYAAAVSDVYQDLFGEGSYAGKGIYDVDAFEAALDGRVPDSTLLSHDLFEGIFARAGLASDVEVVEDFPPRYDVAALRHHRWARGDWQLLPWIFGRGPRGADRRRDGLPAIGRWKMLDNLRRSLSAPAIVLALIAGWAMPLEEAAVWTGFILSTIVLPPLIPVMAEIAPRRPGVTLRSHVRALGAELRLALIQSGLMIVFLAHQAWLMGDAIVRTLVRLTVTRRNLLQWVPAAHAAFGPRPRLMRFYRRMRGRWSSALQR